MAGKIVDVDGHVMEPADLWEKNLEPRFRERALRIRRDERGAEYMEIAGRKSRMMQGGSLGSFGTLDEDVRARLQLEPSSTGLTYEDHVPMAARDMQARLRWMDVHGIDSSLLYPSLCLGWQNECNDPELAAAYCRVYNDWLTDICAPVSERILPIAMVPLIRVEDGVAELRRAAELGARGLYLNPVPMNGIPYGDSSYDPLWAECEERGMPVALHVSNTPLHSGHQFYETSFEKNYWFMMMMYTPDCQIAFTSFFNGAVFERFPALSVGVLEVGCGWVAHWLETMDVRYKLGGHELMKHPPSEYFDRQCWITGEADEKTFAIMARLVGAHKLMWGSDYPHQEGHEHPLAELRETLAELDDADRDKILGNNAVEIYGLG
jgi:predicted TIM-barrel fold metal-dependent hydrolase